VNIHTDQAIVDTFQEAVATMDRIMTPALKGVDMRLFKEWLAKTGVAVRCQDGTLMFQDANPKNDGTTFTLYATCPGTDERHDPEEAWFCVLVGSAK